MGKKKKKAAKPWCWYCDREFDDEKILINHQKAKHFKCYQCHKKLTTASGLAIHLYSVHKETITTVPNAKEGRDALKPDIIGMEGVPDDAIRGHAEGGSDDEEGNKRSRLDQPVPKPYIPPPSNTLPLLSQLGPPPPAPTPLAPKPAALPGQSISPLLSAAASAAMTSAALPAGVPSGPPHGHPGLPFPPMPGMPHMMPGFPGGAPPYGYPLPPFPFMPGMPGMPPPHMMPPMGAYPPMMNAAGQHMLPAQPAFPAYANPHAAPAAISPRPTPDDGFIPVGNQPAAAPAPAAAPTAPVAAPVAAAATSTQMVYDDEFQSPEERRASLRRYSFEPK